MTSPAHRSVTEKRRPGYASRVVPVATAAVLTAVFGLFSGSFVGAALADTDAPSDAGPTSPDDATAPADGRAGAGAVDAPALFVDLLRLSDLSGDDPTPLLDAIDASWQPGYVAMALEAMYFSRRQDVRFAIVALLEDRTGRDHGLDIDAWYHWLWSSPEERHPHYAAFKSRLYGLIDPVFAEYFDDARTTRIRLDEVRWGGVRQDGIPPLRKPLMLDAAEADYLADTDVVFALDYDGDARAYPKRILAWHEMFVDEIAGDEYAGVYCTLCGAVIPYRTVDAHGTRHALGTSGFLYRSNKLMYDRATQSLWSTTLGKPVIGPLADADDIRLERAHVVTTTWGEWRRRHPDTRVLSLDTGHRRDYGEGVAYRDYFATDDLMFTVPGTDERLANKAEILALQFPDETDEVVAIDTGYLAANPVHHDALGPRDVVVLTDASGANRVYAASGTRFAAFDGDASVTDADGATWTLTEAALVGPDDMTRERLPAHRAFWFGWQAVHPDTRLVR